MLGVVGREDQGQRPVGRSIDQRAQLLGGRRLFQFFQIAKLELAPAFRVVAEPFAKLAAGRNLLAPFVEGQRLLPDAARPQPLDEHAISVAARSRLVGSLQLDHPVRLAERSHEATVRSDQAARRGCCSGELVAARDPDPRCGRRTRACSTRSMNTAARFWRRPRTWPRPELTCSRSRGAGWRICRAPTPWLPVASCSTGSASRTTNREFGIHTGRPRTRPRWRCVEQMVLAKPFCRLQHFRRSQRSR